MKPAIGMIVNLYSVLSTVKVGVAADEEPTVWVLENSSVNEKETSPVVSVDGDVEALFPNDGHDALRDDGDDGDFKSDEKEEDNVESKDGAYSSGNEPEEV